MNGEDKRHTGQLYWPGDASIVEEQKYCLEKLYDFNATRPGQEEKRQTLLKEMMAEIGEGCYIEPPLYCNFGGKHVHLGKGVYANFGLTCVDDTHIYIGSYTMIGPGVILATAGHPLEKDLRREGLQFNKPIHIGENCWIGAGAVILPGITIGDNTVIGAGSVVTKDVPSNVVAVGNPCRILRYLEENEKPEEIM